ncbi:hypothetical protein MBANPS3_008336 [Mucor bainieri]
MHFGCQEGEAQQDHTLFDFDYVYYTTPLESFVVFLSAFGDTAMKKLDIDLKFFEEFGHYNDTFSSDLLKAASSSVECLKLNASGLKLKERLDLTRLHTVELIDMYILTENMTHLGLSSPSLKHFTLSSCCLCERQTCSSLQVTQVVNLFSNHLITLSVNGDVISREDRKAGIKEDMHIHLSVGQVEHYFIARRSSNSRHQPSQQNNVDFEDVKFEVEFDNEGNINQANQ